MRNYNKATLLVAALLVAYTHAGAEQIIIKGSNTFGEELGPQLIKAYQSNYPDATFDLESKGSASGIQALMDKACDIAASSRAINDDEQRLAKSRGIKLSQDNVGYYGVTVIVNEKNPVANLTDSQVQQLFTGEIKNWEEVGGTDGPVQLYIRDPMAGTHLGFRELAMKNHPYAETSKSFTSDHDILDAVKADENAVGYVSMIMAGLPGVHAVAINGIPANTASVDEGLYPYVRLVRLYYDKKSISPDARSFIRYVQSKDGQKVIEDTGFVPLRLKAWWF